MVTPGRLVRFAERMDITRRFRQPGLPCIQRRIAIEDPLLSKPRRALVLNHRRSVHARHLQNRAVCHRCALTRENGLQMKLLFSAGESRFRSRPGNKRTCLESGMIPAEARRLAARLLPIASTIPAAAVAATVFMCVQCRFMCVQCRFSNRDELLRGGSMLQFARPGMRHILLVEFTCDVGILYWEICRHLRDEIAGGCLIDPGLQNIGLMYRQAGIPCIRTIPCGACQPRRCSAFKRRSRQRSCRDRRIAARSTQIRRNG